MTNDCTSAHPGQLRDKRPRHLVREELDLLFVLNKAVSHLSKTSDQPHLQAVASPVVLNFGCK